MNTSIKDVKNFISFAAKHLGLRSLPKINLVGNTENSKNAFGHFLGDRKGTSIIVRVTDRHPIDVMRTLAHELIHYKQRVVGSRFSEQMKEDEANALAGRIMREFDMSYPHVFKDKSIQEDGAMGAANATGAGIAGSAGDPDPSKPLAQMLFKKKHSMLTRLMPKKTNQPKSLRDILNKEKSNENKTDGK